MYQEITFNGIGENVTLGGFRVDIKIDGDVIPLDVHVVADGAIRHGLLLDNSFLNKINFELKKEKVRVAKFEEDVNKEIPEILQIDCVQLTDDIELSHVTEVEHRKKVSNLIENLLPSLSQGCRHKTEHSSN